MAITQAQAGKDFKDYPDTSTPIMAADMEALGRANRDARWMIPTGQTSIDEFDDDTLDPAWVRVDGTGAVAGNATWTEKGDGLSVYNAGGDSNATVHGLMRPLSGAGGSVVAGDAFIVGVRLFGPIANFTMAGILLTDGTTHGSGAQALGMTYLIGSSANLTVNAWAGASWNFTGQSVDIAVAQQPLFLRLVCLTTNATWRADCSSDGIHWLTGTTITKAVTPTHVGLMSSSWGTSTKGIATYEFLRRVSGVS